jgi:hypothetical protein
MRGRLKALVLLALALLHTLWRRARGERRPGLERFIENYADDGLTALSASDRAQMADFGRCIACGRCDRDDGARIAASRGQYQGTMSLVLAATRSMPDFGAAARSLAYLTDGDLEKKEALCPTAVPLRRLAAFVRANAPAARVSLPRAQGAKSLPSSFPPSERRARPANPKQA